MKQYLTYTKKIIHEIDVTGDSLYTLKKARNILYELCDCIDGEDYGNSHGFTCNDEKHQTDEVLKACQLIDDIISGIVRWEEEENEVIR